jgi:hypothetical protein
MSIETSKRATPHTHHHAVKFYGTDDSLFTTVAGFLAEGLVARQPAILIATPTHRAAIVEYLSGRLIDCDEAIRKGNLVLLDAAETLGLFMMDDMPDADLFGQSVGRLVQQTVDGRPPESSSLRRHGRRPERGARRGGNRARDSRTSWR